MEGKILIVDDDCDIVNLIADIVEDEGFKTDKVYDGEEALKKALNFNYDLIILDIMLPKIDGYEVCKKIRISKDTPILFLSAKSKNIDKVLGFEFGGDDYVTKPFDDYELLARVKAHIRRNQKSVPISNSNILVIGNMKINQNSYEVYVENKKVELSTKEFSLLLYFVKNKNIVLSREQIYNSVWGFDDYGDINTVTVHIKKLREKIDPEGNYIKTIWGAGYKFTCDDVCEGNEKY